MSSRSLTRGDALTLSALPLLLLAAFLPEGTSFLSEGASFTTSLTVWHDNYITIIAGVWVPSVAVLGSLVVDRFTDLPPISLGKWTSVDLRQVLSAVALWISFWSLFTRGTGAAGAYLSFVATIFLTIGTVAPEVFPAFDVAIGFDEGGVHAEQIEPFWFAVSEPTPVHELDGAGMAISELRPGSWYLADGNHGSGLVVRIETGEHAVLYDLTKLERT